MNYLDDILTKITFWWDSKVLMWWRINAKNPYHWKLVWYTLLQHYPFESNYNYEVLQLCLKKSIYYFENANLYIHTNHINRNLMWMKIAVGLLDIILEKRSLYYYTNHKYKCEVYVNQKNKDRYAILCTDYVLGKVRKSTRMYDKYPHELYKEKALVLLMRILQTYGKDWWD